MKKSYFCIITAAILWGTIGIFIKFLSSLGFSTIQIAQLRSTIALIFISSLLVFKDRQALKIKLRDVWMFLGTGIASYFLFNIFYFTSLKSVGMAVASVLLYTSPIFVAVMSRLFFKEKLGVVKLISLALCVVGCALVSGIGARPIGLYSSFGIIIGIASGFCYALYSIFGVFALRKYSSLTITFYTFLFASLCSFFMSNPCDTVSLLNSPEALTSALLLGVVTGAAPYFLYTKGLSGIEASRAAVIATAEPVVASLIGIFIFGEHPTALTLIGIVFIIGASILVNSGKAIKISKQNVKTRR